MFPQARRNGVIFTYGEVIYTDVPLSDELLAHESVHGARQKDPEAWWARYLTDPEFRYEEELLGHVAEYVTCCRRVADRNRRAKAFHTIALRLSSDLYGGVVTYQKASKAIRARLHP